MRPSPRPWTPSPPPSRPTPSEHLSRAFIVRGCFCPHSIAPGSRQRTGGWRATRVRPVRCGRGNCVATPVPPGVPRIPLMRLVTADLNPAIIAPDEQGGGPGRGGLRRHDHDDAVHVTGHDNPLVQPNLGADLDGPSPCLRRDPPGRIQTHLPADNPTEQTGSIVGAKRDEIDACPRVIVSPQPGASAMMTRGVPVRLHDVLKQVSGSWKNTRRGASAGDNGDIHPGGLPAIFPASACLRKHLAV